jgi:prepilin-type N-terminal cleavage/methylation domain-containing protein
LRLRRPPHPRFTRGLPMLLARSSCRRSGFTLLELLAAMGVVAVLATFAVGAVRGAKSRANIARTRAELGALVAALEEFKRLYGDYPQTGEFGQAPATPTAIATGPGANTAQAKLFNALTGAFGPRAFTNADRVNGPNFLDVGKFTLNGTLTNQFLVPAINAPNPPAKTEQNVALLDPWGRRYFYYYKNSRTPNAWQASGYVLYSAGPVVAANGTQTPPIAIASGLMLATQTAEMADNIYANP